MTPDYRWWRAIIRGHRLGPEHLRGAEPQRCSDIDICWCSVKYWRTGIADRDKKCVERRIQRVIDGSVCHCNHSYWKHCTWIHG